MIMTARRSRHSYFRRKDSCAQSYPQTRASSTAKFGRCPNAFDAELFLDNPLAAWLVVAAASSSLPEPWWRSWRAPPLHRRRRRRRPRSEKHTPELQSPLPLVCRLLLEKKNNNQRD